jgi:hypothetical protein
MKISKYVLAVLAFCPAMAFADGYRTLVSCTADDSTSYAIQTKDDASGRNFIVKTSASGNALRIELAQSNHIVYGYGNTYIATENFGRSGYAHFYASLDSSKSMIDINRFGDTSLNTFGPITNLICRHEE